MATLWRSSHSPPEPSLWHRLGVCGSSVLVSFVLGMMATALAEDELLLEARLPLLAPDTRFGFYEFSRRAGDYALAMALVTFRLQDGAIVAPRIGIGGAEARPRRMAAAEAVSPAAGPTPRASAPRPKPPPTRSSRWKISMRTPNSGSTWCAP